MLSKIVKTTCIVCGLAGLPLIAGTTTKAADYPFQGAQIFRTEGAVTMVDPDRDRVAITASDGRHYNLDTDNARIKLRDTENPGETGDLVAGMRVQVSGRLLSSDIIAVQVLTVLPYRSDDPVEPAPAGRDAPSSDTASTAHSDQIRLRGTVQRVDDDQGVVVVQVNDHTRTVYIDRNTNLTDVPSPDDDHIGVHPGDRITVSGILHQDGAITADVLSLSRDLGTAEHNSWDTDHLIVGRVSQESDRFSTRDIKVRLGSNRQITVHVPHDAQVLRGGRPISVHELTTDDVVRVIGSYDGDDFKATKIDVLEAYENEL